MKFLIIMLLAAFSGHTFAQTVIISVTVPIIHEEPYHRPYIAVWVETPARKGVATLAIWHEKEKWLKDLRQWWRKLGRENQAQYDAVTQATPKPGSYKINWVPKRADGGILKSGEYYVCLEAAREDGGRDFIRQRIQIGGHEAQTYTIDAKPEIGPIKIDIN